MKSDRSFSKEVIKIARPTAEFIAKESEGFKKSFVENKGKNDLVSYVDKEAEKQLVEGLSNLLPEAGIIGEEYEYEANQDGLNWIIDPLDGTTNFIHGVPVYSISIALIDHLELKFGMVYEINRNEIFYAMQNVGAYMNEEQIFVSEENSLSKSLIATGFPYTEFKGLDNYFSILKNLIKECHGIRRLGSAAVDLAYVACGRFEGFFEFNLNSWDVAGGALLVKEAGGLVTDFKGGDNFVFGKEIVAACNIQSQILAIIDDRWEEY